MDDKVSTCTWTEEERAEWNIHKNVAGWALIAFCVTRFLARFQRWEVPIRFAAIFEIVLVAVVLVTAIWAVVARAKYRRHFVPWMSNNQYAFIAGAIVACLYIMLLIIEAIIG